MLASCNGMFISAISTLMFHYSLRYSLLLNASNSAGTDVTQGVCGLQYASTDCLFDQARKPSIGEKPPKHTLIFYLMLSFSVVDISFFRINLAARHKVPRKSKARSILKIPESQILPLGLIRLKPCDSYVPTKTEHYERC